MPASRPALDLNAYARIGAEIAITEHLIQIRAIAAALPDMRDFTLWALKNSALKPHAPREGLSVPRQNLVEDAPKKPPKKAASAAPVTTAPRVGPGRKAITDAGREALRRSMRKRWRAVKKAGGTSLRGKGAQ